ncbi:MAG: prolyl oligopeptidase family serine peptidase [Microthrixaceae bacterium]
MPWDAAELWVGRLPGAESGAPEGVLDARRVAGGHKAGREPVSVCLPKWDDEGRLWWCDDREDRWVLRRAGEPGVPPAGGGDRRPAFWDGGGEVGVPRWASGGSRFAFCADAAAGSGSSAALVAAESLDGLDRMVVVPVAGEPGAPGSGDGVPPGAPAGDGFDDAEPGWVDMVVGDGEHVAAIAGSPRRPTSVLLWGPPASSAGRPPAPRAFGGSAWPLPEESISLPEAVTFATPSRDDAAVGVAHCLFYPPSLAGFEGLDGELPPLVVRIHGGPTGAARAELSPSVQFWTTRGFAVAEVNYRGSSGYGRAYRNELRGGWGRIEVEDCIAAAEHLADRGRVDRGRCVIRGGSAGGLTAIEAVCALPPPAASGSQRPPPSTA